MRFACPFFFGCAGTAFTDRPCAPEYQITIADDFPIENELKAGYCAGEQVTIQLPTVTEQYYRLYVNGAEQEMTGADLTYTAFTFTMPNCDVEIVIEAVSVDIPMDPQN